MKVAHYDSLTGDRSVVENPTMTVAELIAFLSKLPPEFEVGLESDAGRFTLTEADIDVLPNQKLVLI